MLSIYWRLAYTSLTKDELSWITKLLLTFLTPMNFRYLFTHPICSKPVWLSFFCLTHRCFVNVSRIFLRSVENLSKLFLGSFQDVSRVFRSFLSIQWKSIGSKSTLDHFDFHSSKYLFICFAKGKSYRFGATWSWVNDVHFLGKLSLLNESTSRSLWILVEGCM